MYIHVHVYAGAGKEKFIEIKKGYFEAYVCEPAERNEANKRVVEIVRAYFIKDFSDRLGQPVSRLIINLTSGHQSPSKIFRIEQPE